MFGGRPYARDFGLERFLGATILSASTSWNKAASTTKDKRDAQKSAKYVRYFLLNPGALVLMKAETLIAVAARSWKVWALGTAVDNLAGSIRNSAQFFTPPSTM